MWIVQQRSITLEPVNPISNALNPGLLVLAVAAAVLSFVFPDAVADLLRKWGSRDEYSHGYLIPAVSLWLAWRARSNLEQSSRNGRSWALPVCGVALLLLAAGELGSVFVLVQYALIVAIAALAIGWFGTAAVRHLWPAVVFLVFMVPLPQFIYQKLSGTLQLLSSELGVQVIRVFGISVFLEGNVIDLGAYQLQVVEACDGLRYLFPLMSFGFLCAYLFQAPLWQRALVFISAIPVTVAMNSFRIGVIGVLVEHWGTSVAEGFLHDFQGWAVFMASVSLLLIEVWLLVRVFQPRHALTDVFGVYAAPAAASSMVGADVTRPARTVPSVPVRPTAAAARHPVTISLLLLLAAGAWLWQFDDRSEVVPAREQLATFPERLDDWHGRHQNIEPMYLDALRLSDYALVDYRRAESANSSSPDVPINFYVAFYESQRKGRSAHSPASCIPAGGWRISTLGQTKIPGAGVDGEPLFVNRVQIQRGRDRQLVYYWFQQRGRFITNEYLVKGYMLWDSVTINRSDGALVRLTTPIAEGKNWSSGDERLREFTSAIAKRLPHYIPA